MTQLSRLLRDVDTMYGLMEARRCLQSLHGTRYAERIQPWVDLVRAAMRQHGKPPLSAVLVLCGETTDEITHLWLVAAGVEMIDQEPTP